MTAANSMDQKSLFLGIDTSCYTSSAACVGANKITSDKRVLLCVEKGNRGLRQSEALFQHVRNLESLVADTLQSIDKRSIRAVGVSICPSGRENSYMPVFLAGKTVAKSIAAALEVPVYEFTHQQGHIRAALFGNEELIGTNFFAFHLSGGTSELIHVSPSFELETIGGSSDINAGQLVDRLGVKMGLAFPAGKELETLAGSYDGDGFVKLPSSVNGLHCSFSGIETKASALIDAGIDKAELAIAVYDCLARTLSKLIVNAVCKYGTNVFLLAGGVASSDMLKKLLHRRLLGEKVDVHFAEPALSSDNAVGVALLACDAYNSER